MQLKKWQLLEEAGVAGKHWFERSNIKAKYPKLLAPKQLQNCGQMLLKDADTIQPLPAEAWGKNHILSLYVIRILKLVSNPPRQIQNNQDNKKRIQSGIKSVPRTKRVRDDR